MNPVPGKLRIAMIAACPFPYPRGTPVRVFRMAEALALRGHDVHVLTYHLGEPLPPVPFRVHRIPRVWTYRRHDPGPTYQKLLVLDLLLRRRLRGLLRRFRFDLIHAHHYEGLLIATSLQGPSVPPVVYDAHTLLSSELPFYGLGLSTRLKARIGAFLDRTLPGRAAHVISVTGVLRDRLVAIGAVPAERVSVIESGVEGGLFDVAPAVHRNGDKTIVFAGNLAAYQGIEHLLRAFQVVRRRRSDVRLQLVTPSPFHAYEALAGALGVRDHIDLVDVGFERLPPYLRAADVAVNPRLECEGAPQKLLNYMAAGCPIVSFEGSAAHLAHLETGWVVPNGDVAGMAEAILHMLDDRGLADRLGAAARQQIAREYSWEQNAIKTEAVYAHLLGRPAAQLATV